MTPMEIATSIIGHLFMVCASFGIALVPLAIIADKLQTIYDRWLWNEQTRGAHAAGKLMVNQAYWFSEDKSAKNALIAAGESFRDCGAMPDTQKVRERWRQLNAQEDE